MTNQKDQDGPKNQDAGNGGQSQAAYGNSNDAQQSRGERFDELQGGGRGGDSVSPEGGADPAEDAQLDAQADQLLGEGQADRDRAANEDAQT